MNTIKEFICLVVAIVLLSACQKAKIVHGPSAVGKDTIPDGASFKLLMATDSTGSEYPSTDTMGVRVNFNHTYSVNYSPYKYEDGAKGSFGNSWDFSALSNDGGELIVDGIPYYPGVAIPLLITSEITENHEQHFILSALNLVSIPDDIHIWCKDSQSKDSADIRNKPFRFYFHHNDTSSYGSNRFKVIIEPY